MRASALLGPLNRVAPVGAPHSQPATRAGALRIVWRGGASGLARMTSSSTAHAKPTSPHETSAVASSAPARVQPFPVPVQYGSLGNASSSEEEQDVGNVVLLEHVNLEEAPQARRRPAAVLRRRHAATAAVTAAAAAAAAAAAHSTCDACRPAIPVPDLEVARLFYGEGLGLAADPATTAQQRGGLHVMWYNIGRQQFHIAKGPTAQRLPQGGVIGIVLPDIQAAAARLENVKQLLGDVAISYVSHDTLEVVDPYGVIFVVHAALPYFPAQRGIAYLQLPCFPGTAAAIARFYAAHMGARCTCSAISSSTNTEQRGSSSGAAGTEGGGPPSPGGEGGSAAAATTSAGAPELGGAAQRRRHSGGGAVRAEVYCGPGQKLLFVEQAQLGPPADQAVRDLFEGWHVAMYVADFSRCYRLVEQQGLLFNDHPYRDKCHSLQDALRNRQFRFQDIPLLPPPRAAASGGDAGGGGVPTPDHASALPPGPAAPAPTPPPLAYRVSHEVRSMHHPLFARALFNRDALTLV